MNPLADVQLLSIYNHMCLDDAKRGTERELLKSCVSEGKWVCSALRVTERAARTRLKFQRTS